jgi:hypothetical protein
MGISWVGLEYDGGALYDSFIFSLAINFIGCPPFLIGQDFCKFRMIFVKSNDLLKKKL